MAQATKKRVSKIGRRPIPIPQGVDVKVEGTTITVKGPKGQLSWRFPDFIEVKVEDNMIKVAKKEGYEGKFHRAMHGTSRALIANMVKGVTEGYEKVLEIVGTGYRAKMQGRKLVLTIGYSHPVEYEPPEGVEVSVDERGTTIYIRGIDKQLVGQVAATIRSFREPDPYKGKGIRYRGEEIRLKPGKAGKAGK